ncbi:Sugar diacid regulator [Ewingella americana]|uniref:Sugar diacid regulator n=1 Tax=Ewingella americana TaxID=41202 RepID=A0A377NGZ7_9GAMM|nr:Sugar diacid regulator [Ewingella americana]
MATYFLENTLAQQIVDRTMQIIDSNVNVMDSRGRIIGSGDAERLGELHEGALLAISQQRIVDIDNAVTRHLHGVRPGVNLPLRVDGQIVGAIGLSGDPTRLRQYGELVCMTAEMMLEQSRLLKMLAHDSRIREELVLNLIRAEQLPAELVEWAQRLGIDLHKPRVAVVVAIDSGQLGVEHALAELQQLQALLSAPEQDNLIATVSLSEIVVLKPALNAAKRWDPEAQRQRVDGLIARMDQDSEVRIRVALGNYFTGPGSLARSYFTAKTTMAVGKQRAPQQRSYCYQDLMLPVLLDGLRDGWQADELALPMARLNAKTAAACCAARWPSGLLITFSPSLRLKHCLFIAILSKTG